MMKYPDGFDTTSGKQNGVTRGNGVSPDFQVVIARKWENVKNVIPHDPLRDRYLLYRYLSPGKKKEKKIWL